MREEIEKRLHRVSIRIRDNNIKCPLSQHCEQAENGHRCNEFFLKCSKYENLKIEINKN
jgi:hypothetical protein